MAWTARLGTRNSKKVSAKDWENKPHENSGDMCVTCSSYFGAYIATKQCSRSNKAGALQ